VCVAAIYSDEKDEQQSNALHYHDHGNAHQSSTDFIDLHPTTPVKSTETTRTTPDDVVCTVCVLKGCTRDSLTGTLNTCCRETPDSRGGPHVQNRD